MVSLKKVREMGDWGKTLLLKHFVKKVQCRKLSREYIVE